MEKTTTTIDLIRHGEPVGGSKYRGQIDDQLSDKGWKQMRDVVANHCPWQSIISSPLSRCAAYAEEVAQRHSLPLEFDERLIEIGFGEWEGLTKNEITAQAPQALQLFYADPITHRPPGAETLIRFQQRIVAAWQAILNNFAGQHLLLVGHAGVIRMVMSHVLGSPPENMFRIIVPNAGVTRIRVDGVGEQAVENLIFHAGCL